MSHLALVVARSDRRLGPFLLSVIATLALAVSVSVPVGTQNAQPSPAYLDYDTFWTMPVPPRERPWSSHDSRMDVFRTLSPQNKADLHVTQCRRWIAVNRARLTQEQLAFLDEMIAAIPSSYLQARTPELEARYTDLTDRLWKLFGKTDAIGASSVDGARYIPPTP